MEHFNYSTWQKYKKSGSYTREKKRNLAHNSIVITREPKSKIQQNIARYFDPLPSTPAIDHGLCVGNGVKNRVENYEEEREYQDLRVWNNWFIELDDEDMNKENEVNNVEDEEEEEIDFKEHLLMWSTMNGISFNALNALLRIVRKTPEFKNKLPKDSRSLAKIDYSNIVIKSIGNGKYWHFGVANCLRYKFSNLNRALHISLNISIDGLPLFKSSSEQFWPILANIFEMPDLNVMTIGIYCGPNKPKRADFVREFANEMKEIMREGVIINGIKVIVAIRAFICDSPARSQLKG